MHVQVFYVEKKMKKMSGKTNIPIIQIIILSCLTCCIYLPNKQKIDGHLYPAENRPPDISNDSTVPIQEPMKIPGIDRNVYHTRT